MIPFEQPLRELDFKLFLKDPKGIFTIESSCHLRIFANISPRKSELKEALRKHGKLRRNNTGILLFLSTNFPFMNFNLIQQQFEQQQHTNEVNSEHASKLFLKDPITHTQSPMVTGSSILGLKYNGGVLLLADTLGSWGKLARFRSVSRLRVVGDRTEPNPDGSIQVSKKYNPHQTFTLVGGSGDYSDFQHISEKLNEFYDNEIEMDDGSIKNAGEIHQYLTRMMYARRNQFDPLWNSLVVAGCDSNLQPYLGYVDLIGTNYSDNHVATGYGAYLALPILRKVWEKTKGNVTQTDAKNALIEAMRILLYRDCCTINKFQFANVTPQGVEVSSPFEMETKWDFEGFDIRQS